MRKNQMQYNWGLFLEAAKRWFNDMQDDEDETLIRCGISRSYYAAFHVCQQYLISIDMGADVHGDGSHMAVIKSFKQLGDAKTNRECKKISVDLSRLKNRRISADYRDVLLSGDPSYIGTKKKVLEQSIKEADSIIHMISKLPDFDYKC